METTHPSLLGFMNTIIFTNVLITSFIGVGLLENFGSEVTFGFFAITTTIGFVIFVILIKDTTFSEENDEEEVDINKVAVGDDEKESRTIDL
jgi:dipeptide/tripeptide permease